MCELQVWEKSPRIWVQNVKCVKHISYPSGDIQAEIRDAKTFREGIDTRDVNLGVLS